MGDAKLRALEREALVGDLEAQRRFMAMLRRSNDPSLVKAARLRTELRRRVALLQRGYAGEANGLFVLLNSATRVMQGALEGDRAFGYAYETVFRGTDDMSVPIGACVLAVRFGDELRVGVGAARNGKVGPSTIWQSLERFRRESETEREESLKTWLSDESARAARWYTQTWSVGDVRTVRSSVRHDCHG